MFKFFNKTIRKKAVLFTKCSELPIHNFNEIANNNDFNYLKVNKTDTATDEELMIAWLVILDEYFRISKNVHGISILKKKTSLMFLQKKLQVFEALQICLSKNINVEKEMILYKTNKDIIKIHVGMIKNDIQRVFKSLPVEENRKEDNEFDRTVAVILKNGFQINRFKTTVSEWVQILQLIEQQNKNAN